MSNVTVFVENRQSGSHKDASVPINGKAETFSSLWGNGITGNAIGVNGQLPTNATIVFGPPGHPKQYTLGEDPTVISPENEEQNLSNWTITATQN